MAGEQQATTETGLPPLPEAAGSAVCPWCCGPVEEWRHTDRASFGFRFVLITLFCADCDLVIRLDWPSAPHRRAPHG